MLLTVLAAASISTSSVLVFTKTAGYRHDAIPVAREALREVCKANGMHVSMTEDASWFDDKTLRSFHVVVFLLATGDVLNDSQQNALEKFVRSGGGFVGVHSATDTEYDWPWYGRLVGAYFASHPPTQQATIDVVDRKHPTTTMLPAKWVKVDEWYDFRENPRPQVNVLATVDESTYKGGKMGADHPILWWHEKFGGRAWYTALGHTQESYRDPLFMKMLLAAIKWTAKKD